MQEYAENTGKQMEMCNKKFPHTNQVLCKFDNGECKVHERYNNHLKDDCLIAEVYGLDKDCFGKTTEVTKKLYHDDKDLRKKGWFK